MGLLTTMVFNHSFLWLYIYIMRRPQFFIMFLWFSQFSRGMVISSIYFIHNWAAPKHFLQHFCTSTIAPASCSSRSKSAPSSMAIAMPALPSPCPRIGHNSKWLEETWIEPSTIYNSLYTIPYYTYKQNLQVDDAIYIRFRFVPGLMTWSSKHLTLINGEPLELTFKIQTCK